MEMSDFKMDCPGDSRGGASRRVLGLPGSLRKGSYNRLLLKAAAYAAPAGVEVVVYEDLELVPLFDEDLELATSGGPEGVRQLRAHVAAADGVLVATPEYNQSFPGVLKNAIDWLSRPAPVEALARKPVAIIGASTGRWGTRLAQSHLRHVLYAVGSLVLPKPSLFVSDAADLFDSDSRLTDPSTCEALKELLASFDAWMASTAAVLPVGSCM